jgi:hypothetical protein
MDNMNVVEKRDYIHNHLSKIKEPALNELYYRLTEILEESLLEESEDDIKNGNLTSHEALKREVESWRSTK